MKKIEKILKQKITGNIESKLTSYKLKYSLEKEITKNRRISKNQYKLLNITNDSENILKIKFPFSFNSDSKPTNLEVKKENKCIIPLHFQLKNKNFSFDTKANFENLLRLRNPIFLFTKILYESKNNQNKISEVNSLIGETIVFKENKYAGSTPA
jgi:hypothetical protein